METVTYVAIEGDKLKSLINLLNELDNDEDVQQVFQILRHQTKN